MRRGRFLGALPLAEHGWCDALERDGEPRFEMLETIAEFARERLAGSGELDEVARRHAEYLARSPRRSRPTCSPTRDGRGC